MYNTFMDLGVDGIWKWSENSSIFNFYLNVYLIYLNVYIFNINIHIFIYLNLYFKNISPLELNGLGLNLK